MNSALSYLKRQRRRIEDQQALEGRSQTFSLARYQLHTQLTRVIDSHAYGICLDIGSGHAPFKQKLATIASRVICMDVEDRIGRTDIIADVQNMPDMEDASIDTVLCSQVLEHVPRPWDALSEIHRVLKQGGKAILSVPQEFRVVSLSLGATRWQTIRHQVLPHALPGIITGIILGLGRAAGETAPILFTVAAFYLPELPKSIFDQTMALPYHLYVIATQVPGMPMGIQYGTAFILLLIVLSLTLIATAIRSTIRRRREW